MLFLFLPFLLLWLFFYFILGTKVLPEKQVMSVQPYICLYRSKQYTKDLFQICLKMSLQLEYQLSFLPVDEGVGTVILLAPCEVFCVL